MFQKAQSVRLKAGVMLAKWKANCPLDCNKLSIADGEQQNKVLGVIWSPNSDCFTFEGVSIPDNLIITKRVVLSFVARIYDPLGVFSHF